MAVDGTITWRDLLAETAVRLRRSGVVDDDVASRVEARWLCEAASGMSGAAWILGQSDAARQRALAHLDAMAARRVAGEPVQYVLGSWAFRSLELMLDRRVLIPRPETEQLVDVALGLARLIDSPRTIVDLGTGSGAIALSLAAELPIGSVDVWATDVSTDALDVARANLAGLGRHGSAVRLVHGDWFDALPAELRGAADLIVANPPYIADSAADVDAAVREWEPPGALFAGHDGLDAIRAIVAGARSWLSGRGALVMEIGTGQGASVATLLRDAGLEDVEIRADHAGHDRIAIASQSGGEAG